VVTGNCKEWVMKVCTGFMWLMIGYRSGFYIQASSTTTVKQNIQIFQNDTDGSGFQS